MTIFARSLLVSAALVTALATQAPAFDTRAKAAFVIDQTTGTVLLTKRADEALPPASMSKLMTLYIAFEAIKNGEIQLVFNTTDGPQALADSRSLRRAALLHKVPYYTTLAGAIAAAEGIKAYCSGDLEVRSLQSYFARAA